MGGGQIANNSIECGVGSSKHVSNAEEYNVYDQRNFLNDRFYLLAKELYLKMVLGGSLLRK